MENLYSEAAGLKSWLRSYFSPSGLIRLFSEGLIPSFAEKMKVVREMDDRISAEIDETKKIVNSMKIALKAARYVDVAILLEQFHVKLNEIFVLGSNIKTVQEEALQEFDKVHNVKAMFDSIGFAKDAGVIDYLKDRWTDLKRNYVSRKFEDKFREERRRGLEGLVANAESFYSELARAQSTLGGFRAAGEIGQYLNTLVKLDESYKTFKIKTDPVYNKYLAPLVNDIRKAESEFEAEQARVQEEAGQANSIYKSKEEAKIEDEAAKANRLHWEQLGNNLPPKEKFPSLPEEETRSVTDDEIETVEPYTGEFDSYINENTSLNKKDPSEFDQYLNELGKDYPTEESKGSFTSGLEGKTDRKRTVTKDLNVRAPRGRDPQVHYNEYLNKANKAASLSLPAITAAYIDFLDELETIEEPNMLREVIAAYSANLEMVDEQAAGELLLIAGT